MTSLPPHHKKNMCDGLSERSSFREYTGRAHEGCGICPKENKQCLFRPMNQGRFAAGPANITRVIRSLADIQRRSGLASCTRAAGMWQPNGRIRRLMAKASRVWTPRALLASAEKTPFILIFRVRNAREKYPCAGHRRKAGKYSTA